MAALQTLFERKILNTYTSHKNVMKEDYVWLKAGLSNFVSETPCTYAGFLRAQATQFIIDVVHS
jgi:hypothetical protein